MYLPKEYNAITQQNPYINISHNVDIRVLLTSDLGIVDLKHLQLLSRHTTGWAYDYNTPKLG